MKKLIIAISLFFCLLLYSYCELVQQGDYITVNNIVTLISLEDELQEAYLNCLKYISNSSFDRKSHIKANIVSVSDLIKELYDSVWSTDGDEEILDINTNYLLFTIGDTSGHDFSKLVCDSETNDVIGYIPID